MPGQDHFEGNRNLTPGTRAGLQQILPEMLGPTPSVRWVDVNTEVPSSDQDGSSTAPYDTIQAAVDDLAQDREPTNMRLVAIMPGLYAENVVVRTSAIIFRGVAGRDATFVIPASGPAFTFTNATLDSLAAYRASGNYNDLVYDPSLDYSGAGPRDASLMDLYWDDGSYTGPGLELLGVKGDASGTTTSFLDGAPQYVGFQTWRCYTSSPVYGRNFGYYQHEQHLAGADIELYNYGDVRLFNARINGLTCEYDPASPYGNTSRVGPNWLSYQFSVMTSLTLNGQARTKSGVPGFRTFTSIDDVVVNDTAIFTSAHAYISGDLVCEGGASYAGYHDTIDGNLTFQSGAGTAVLIGGRYFGSLTDPDVKFTHTQGNIGV